MQCAGRWLGPGCQLASWVGGAGRDGGLRETSTDGSRTVRQITITGDREAAREPPAEETGRDLPGRESEAEAATNGAVCLLSTL